MPLTTCGERYDTRKPVLYKTTPYVKEQCLKLKDTICIGLFHSEVYTGDKVVEKGVGDNDSKKIESGFYV